MLTDAQLYHFAVHGWVLQEDAFSPEEVDAFKRGLDHLYERKVSTMKDTEDIKNINNMVNYDPIYRDWIMSPKITPHSEAALGNAAAF